MPKLGEISNLRIEKIPKFMNLKFPENVKKFKTYLWNRFW